MPLEKRQTKCCNACRKIKPLSEFTHYKTKEGGSRYRHICKPCAVQQALIWRHNKSAAGKRHVDGSTPTEPKGQSRTD